MKDQWTAPTRRGVMGLIAVTVAGGVMIPQRLFAQSAGNSLISNADVCLLVPEVTEGPYYFDPALVRADITEGKEGLATPPPHANRRLCLASRSTARASISGIATPVASIPATPTRPMEPAQ